MYYEYMHTEQARYVLASSTGPFIPLLLLFQVFFATHTVDDTDSRIFAHYSRDAAANFPTASLWLLLFQYAEGAVEMRLPLTLVRPLASYGGVWMCACTPAVGVAVCGRCVLFRYAHVALYTCMYTVHRPRGQRPVITYPLTLFLP